MSRESLFSKKQQGRSDMKPKILSVLFCAALLGSTAIATAQDDSAANGSTSPLWAKGGVDSPADKIAAPGAVNTGAFDMKTWKYGHAWDPPAGGSVIWNPVKAKMMAGGKLTSVTVNGNASPADYCAAANSGVDFIWTEVQHRA